MIRHVAFDFDGTLVRSNKIKRDCFYETVADVAGAAAILDDLFASHFRGDRFALFGEVTRRLGNGALDAGALASAYGRRCRERIAAVPEVPGAQAALNRLAAGGAKLFLISATPQQALEEVVADRGLTRFFDLVLGAPTAKAVHLRNVMARHRLAPAQIAMVGDGIDDQDAAAEIGCKFIAVSDQPNVPLEQVEIRMPDLHRLPELLGHGDPGAIVSARGSQP
jgi:phosphoglycolate phosphatase-like HAD superfamily hydrolase